MLVGEDFKDTHLITTSNINGTSLRVWGEFLLDYMDRRKCEIPAANALNQEY